MHENAPFTGTFDTDFQMKQNQKFYGIVLLPIVSIVLVTLLYMVTQDRISEEITEEFLQHTEENFIQENKNAIKSKVLLINSLIEEENARVEKELKEDIKEKLDIAFSVADNIYRADKDRLSYAQLRQKVAEHLSVIRFYENRGYYHILDYDSEVVLGHGIKNLIGKDFSGFKDAKGTKIIQKQKELIEKNGIAYVKLYFYKPDDPTHFYPKMIVAAKYEPLNLLIGTGEYLDVVEQRVKARVIERVFTRNAIDRKNYIFIHEILKPEGGEGFARILATLAKGQNVGKLVSSHFKDARGYAYREEMLKKLYKDGEAYVQYYFSKPNSTNPSPKLSYFYFNKEWNWIIGSGFYMDEYEAELEKLKENVYQRLQEQKNEKLYTVFMILVVITLVALVILLRYRNVIASYTGKITEQNRELLEYQNRLEERVKEEVSKQREQEKIMIQQSRLAAMGEMIGNIAHQWRQPLNSLGLLLQNQKRLFDRNQLNSDKVNEATKKAMMLIEQMSRTIDDFREFFKPSKQKKCFVIGESIEQSIQLMQSSLEHAGIDIQSKLSDSLEVMGYPHELSQVLLNLYSNARDAILASKKSGGVIQIECRQSGQYAQITVTDNGGGIPETVLPYIFDPYFTTKEEGRGTGIGLYMSKTIIEKHMDGKLTAFNVEHGACFEIALPMEESF